MRHPVLLLLGLSSTALADPATVVGSEPGTPEDRADVPSPGDDFGPKGIINGDDAALEDYPMAGALLVDAHVTMGGFGAGQQGQLHTFICSSTLIAPDVVLLAAHCVDEFILSQGGSVRDLEFLWTRQTDLSDLDSPTDPWPDDAVAAWDWVMPPEWDPSNMEDFGTGAPKHDIALLFLDQAVTDVPYAYLPRPEEAAQVHTGAEVDVVGWGMMEPIGLLESFSPPEPGTFGIKQVGTSVIADVGEFEFQVGADPDDVRKCKGDSGGPTFLRVDTDTTELTRLIGVTSRSADYSLCESKGGYDTRVDWYLDWIAAEMELRCEDGSRAWCDEPGIIDPASGDEAIVACGCSASGGAFGGLPVLLAGLLVARRRR